MFSLLTLFQLFSEIRRSQVNINTHSIITYIDVSNSRPEYLLDAVSIYNTYIHYNTFHISLDVRVSYCFLVRHFGYLFEDSTNHKL